MKKKIVYLLLVFLGVFIGCDDADEVPPKVQTYDTNFVLPVPKVLTAEERAYIEQRQTDYENMIKQ